MITEVKKKVFHRFIYHSKLQVAQGGDKLNVDGELWAQSDHDFRDAFWKNDYLFFFVEFASTINFPFIFPFVSTIRE